MQAAVCFNDGEAKGLTLARFAQFLHTCTYTTHMAYLELLYRYKYVYASVRILSGQSPQNVSTFLVPKSGHQQAFLTFASEILIMLVGFHFKISMMLV